MHRKLIISLIIAGTLVLVAALGVITYRSVSAQAPTPTPNGALKPGFGRGFAGGYTQQDLANALGISLDKLQSAIQSANSEALKQAVAAGVLTQQQADQLSSRGLDRFPFGMAGGWLKSAGIDYNSLLANALGISTDKLTAAYQQAFNTALDNAVKNGKITQAQADLIKARNALFGNANFQSAMQSAFQAAVQQAVKDGVITQAQADQLLQQNSSAPGFMGKGFGWFGGPGGFGGMRGFGRHGFRGNGQPANPSATPTVTPSNGL